MKKNVRNCVIVIVLLIASVALFILMKHSDKKTTKTTDAPVVKQVARYTYKDIYGGSGKGTQCGEREDYKYCYTTDGGVLKVESYEEIKK